MFRESEMNEEVAVETSVADSCGKPAACQPAHIRFIPVSGPPPPGPALAAVVRSLAPQVGSDRGNPGSDP